MVRVDVLLVEQGLAPSRSAAQQWIAAGRVSVDTGAGWVAVSKPSLKLAADVVLRVSPELGDHYVSRGGIKLQGALAHCGVSVEGAYCLDVGISTGGFTDCLLQAGAARVVGVDVGHSQLAPRLSTDKRLVLLEGVNARHLQAEQVLAHTEQRPVDLIVVDVSFISLTLVLPAALGTLAASGAVLALVKPQFEVGPHGVGKGGIVRDVSLYADVEQKIRLACAGLSLRVDDYFASSIAGGDGNREFFVYAHREAPHA